MDIEKALNAVFFSSDPIILAVEQLDLTGRTFCSWFPFSELTLFVTLLKDRLKGTNTPLAPRRVADWISYNELKLQFFGHQWVGFGVLLEHELFLCNLKSIKVTIN